MSHWAIRGRYTRQESRAVARKPCDAAAVGMGSNADGNTAVKCKRDEQCSLVTLFTAFCSCMDCKLCSLGLEMDKNRSL